MERINKKINTKENKHITNYVLISKIVFTYRSLIYYTTGTGIKLI